MEVNKHIAFSEKYDTELVKYLIQNNIQFDSGEIVSCLDIYESDFHWKFISEYVKDKKLSCISHMVFSRDEINNAEWLTVRSQWRNGYPQPEGAFEYETITYTRDEHCSNCGCGLKQVDSFRFKKQPKWGNRHVMMLNWVEDELFVDNNVKTVFLNEGISGISFKNIVDKQGKKILDDVNQLVIKELEKEGCVEGSVGLYETIICPDCGVKKHHPNGCGKIVFHKNIFENAPDIIKTKDYFGWGKGASKAIIVRQNVLQTIKKNHLERGLIFEPIDLI